MHCWFDIRYMYIHVYAMISILTCIANNVHKTLHKLSTANNFKQLRYPWTLSKKYFGKEIWAASLWVHLHRLYRPLRKHSFLIIFFSFYTPFYMFTLYNLHCKIFVLNNIKNSITTIHIKIQNHRKHLKYKQYWKENV